VVGENERLVKYRYRRNRRAEGLCGYEGCTAKSETYYCDEHRRLHRERMRQARAEATAEEAA